MWPEPVERIASFLRESEAHGQLEELPEGVDTPPGTGARAEAFECDREHDRPPSFRTTAKSIAPGSRAAPGAAS
jgi:hypothetical protein